MRLALRLLLAAALLVPALAVSDRPEAYESRFEIPEVNR